MGHTSIKLNKSKLLTGLTFVLKENYKYTQKKNLVQKFFLCKPYYNNFMKILWKLQLFWSKHAKLTIPLILDNNFKIHFFP
jgi:hypothetical protein